MTNITSKILGGGVGWGRKLCRYKTWATRDVLGLCGEKRDLKKKRYEAVGVIGYEKATTVDSEGSEESAGGLDRHSVRGDRNLP